MSKSTNFFEQHQNASEKLDYFISGVTGALFAYLAQTYTPAKIAFSPAVLEPIALLLLAGSFFFGLKRLEASITTIGGTALQHFHAEQAELAIEAAAHRKATFSGGNFISPQDLARQKDKCAEKVKEIQAQLTTIRMHAFKLYRVRNFLLLTGFASILAAKILAPYSK